MTAWWYWALFCLAALLVAAVPVCAYLERRSDDRDHELWEQQPGAVR